MELNNRNLTFTVSMDVNLFERIEATRGNGNRSKLICDIVGSYFENIDTKKAGATA